MNPLLELADVRLAQLGQPPATNTPPLKLCGYAKKSSSSVRLPLNAFTSGPPPGPCAGQDRRTAVDVHAADAQAAQERRRIRQERLLEITVAVENAHLRSDRCQRRADREDVERGRRLGADDHLRLAVAVDIARRHEDAAGEGRAQGVETGQHLKTHAVEDRHLGPAAGPVPAMMSAWPAPYDVARRHAHAAGERGGERVEALNQAAILAGTDIDLRSAARVGSTMMSPKPSAVHVADRHEDAAGERCSA